jgi:hypothetical protein
MERVNALINKLQEQATQHATAADLLNTVQLLQAELVRHITAPVAAPPRPAGTGKVSVVMPAARVVEYEYANGNANSAAEPNGNGYVNGGNNNGYQNGSYPNNNSNYQPVPPPVEKPAPKETLVPKEAPVLKEAPPVQKYSSDSWPLDPLKEVPTLAHQERAKELNDVIGYSHTSLNDRLKSGQTELSDVLTEIPLRDLKKAIGINDRYVFVNELFRGDEAMYERSLKTINAFRILPEAEYWVERELKVRLGWDDGKTTTQHFYQLVKRRFS